MKDQLHNMFVFLRKKHIVFFLCIITSFIVPNEGSPLISADTPFNTMLSRLVLGVAVNRLVMIFIDVEYIPYISMILLTFSVIFIPHGIHRMIHFFQNVSYYS